VKRECERVCFFTGASVRYLFDSNSSDLSELVSVLKVATFFYTGSEVQFAPIPVSDNLQFTVTTRATFI
jgi:hypothetical protein